MSEGHPDIRDVGPGDVVACHAVFCVVGADPMLLHLEKSGKGI